VAGGVGEGDAVETHAAADDEMRGALASRRGHHVALVRQRLRAEVGVLGVGESDEREEELVERAQTVRLDLQ